MTSTRDLTEMGAGERAERDRPRAAHAVRRPVRARQAEVECAWHRTRSEEDMRTVLGAVEDEVDRMTDLANALLDLEELESGVKSSEAEIDIRAVLQSTADRYRTVLRREGRDIQVDAAATRYRLSEPWVGAALSNLV